METQCLGDEQRQKPDSLEQTLLIVFVIEEAIPVYFGQNAWLEKYLVMVGFDDVQAVSYSSQAEPSIADTIENTGEATLVIRKKYWGSDEVITFVAPILPLPTLRKSIFFNNFTIINPKGIEPNKYDTIIHIIYNIIIFP